MMDKDPIKTIQEYREKGYVIELSVDSMRSVYAINMSSPNDLKKFTVPINKYPILSLHNAVRGI
jgi:hypothetical protein